MLGVCACTESARPPVDMQTIVDRGSFDLDGASPDFVSDASEPITVDNTASLEFDGVDDVAILVNGTPLSSPLVSAFDRPFTIEAWIQVALSASGAATIVALRAATIDQELVYALEVDGSAFYCRANFVSTTVEASAPGIVAGRWQHVACVSDGLQLLAFVDGQPGPRVFVVPLTPKGGILSLGARTGSGMRRFFSGRIDEVRFWSVARKASELLSSRALSYEGGWAGLAASWTLNAGEGQPLVDGTGRHTAFGYRGAESLEGDDDPQWSDDVPF